MVLAAIGIRAQVLAAVLEPTHRRSDAHREPGQRHLFATEQALVAEAAAHVGRNHANRTVVEAQALGHAALHDMRLWVALMRVRKPNRASQWARTPRPSSGNMQC